MSKFEEIHATYADHVVLQCLVHLRKIIHCKERSVIAERVEDKGMPAHPDELAIYYTSSGSSDGIRLVLSRSCITPFTTNLKLNRPYPPVPWASTGTGTLVPAKYLCVQFPQFHGRVFHGHGY